MAAPPNHNCADVLRHLYVHIPFCARICPYCAFYKELLDRSETNRFCQAVVRELEQHAQDNVLQPSTIYFGGGTPTALASAHLEFVLRAFQETVDLSRLTEWTIEANPGSVSQRKADLLRKFGINRISLGVQSWDDGLLKVLGREHDSRQAEQSFRIFRGVGFNCVSIDLMFGLPGQTIEQWRTTLEKTISLEPEHISTYCLTYEEDTEFFLRHARGELRKDSDTEAEFFEMTMSILAVAGYEQYEVSNYARPGFRSAHNCAYWAGEDYLGIGPSAFSTVGAARWQNVPDFRRYADRVLSNQSPVGSVETLTEQTKRGEKIALSLRTREGVAASLLDRFPSEVGEFVRLGLLSRSSDRFALTSTGKLLADSVAEAFV